MTPTLFLFLLGTAITLRVVWWALSAWQHARNARNLGCGSIPTYPSDFFGIRNLRDTLRADKEKLVPELVQRRVDELSVREGRYVSTYNLYSLNRTNITTVDPKNIQAVLATQFKDFELGVSRRNALHPLLGTGIVCSRFLNPFLSD